MPSILRLLDLLLCGLLSITPIFVNGIPQDKLILGGDLFGGQGSTTAAVRADRSKSEVEPPLLHVLNDHTNVTCDLRGMARLPQNFESCHAAVVQASSHTNGHDVQGSLQESSSFWSDGM